MIDTNLLKKVKDSKELYHIYIQGDYLYMIKPSDCREEIPKTRILRDRGVNFAGPISQLKLDDGLYLLEEHLAKGKHMESFRRSSNCNINYTPEEIEGEYINHFIPYFEEIKLRAQADQAIYDKLISDILEMNKEGLTIDTCSIGNLFFDKDIGFTIIDAYPYDGSIKLDTKALFWLIRGNIPDLTFKMSTKFIPNAIPIACYEEFMNCLEIIKQKYISSLKKYNIDYDDNLIEIEPTIITSTLIKETLEKESEAVIRI